MLCYLNWSLHLHQLLGLPMADLTITIAAGLVSFVTAWAIKGIEHTKSYREKRVSRADETVSNLSIYIESWRKVMLISSLGQGRDLVSEECQRLERYITERDNAKHKLTACLATLPLYFDKKVVAISRSFREWDRQQSAKRLHELPQIDEWEFWLERISFELRSHL